MPGWLKCLAFTCALAAHFLFSAHAAAEERTWTSADGRTMRAEFVREAGGEATFLKDGQLVTLPLTRLSERDQQIVRDLAAGRPVADETPPAASGQASGQATTPTDAVKPAEGKKKATANVYRVWTALDGDQQTAKFVRMNGRNVVLLTRGNKTIQPDFHLLSSEDQDFLRELLTAQGKEVQIPPAPPPRPAAQPGEGGPGIPGPPSFPQPNFPAPGPPPPVPGAGSSLLEEMKARAEQQREESRQRIEEMNQRAEQQRQEQRQRMEQLQQERDQKAAEARQKFQEDLDRRREEREQLVQQTTIVGTCLSCKGSLTHEQTQRDTCPHCGVKWNFEVDQFGKRRPIYRNSSGAGGAVQLPKLDAATAVTIRKVVVIGVVVVGVVGMLAVVIFVAITIAAASGNKSQRRFS